MPRLSTLKQVTRPGTWCTNLFLIKAPRLYMMSFGEIFKFKIKYLLIELKQVHARYNTDWRLLPVCDPPNTLFDF